MEFKGKIRNFHDIWKKDEDNVDITYNLSLLNMDMEKVFNETYKNIAGKEYYQIDVEEKEMIKLFINIVTS